MASQRPVVAEWYQSETHVTASVSIKGVPETQEITYRLDPRHCALLIGGEVAMATRVITCSSLQPLASGPQLL